MDADERAELQSLSREELLDVFEGGLFELVTDGNEYTDLLEMTLALGIKGYVRDKLTGLSSEELIEMFLDSEQVVVGLVDYAAEQGLLDER
ncbi:MAG: hypothetical protein KKE73_14055 [Proteobacteria bacterium]|nr:hypothetical protein [Pseudomonadota bacterium]